MGSVNTPDIPDPTADLFWSDFKGPIHEIFAANARKHPDRPCVVETATSKSPENFAPDHCIVSGSLDIAGKNVGLGAPKIVSGIMTSLYLVRVFL